MRIYISIILSLNFFIGLSQELVLPNYQIKEVDFRASDGYLQLATEEGKYYTYDGKVAKEISENDYITFAYDSDLSFNGNTGYYKKDSVIVGATINDVHILNDELFIASEDGVYLSPIPLTLVGKKLFGEDFKTLSNVKKIWSERGSVIFSNEMDSLDGNLFVWNPSLDQIRNIYVQNVNDISADPFGNLWLATDDGLYQWSDFSQDKKNIPLFNLSEVQKNNVKHAINNEYLIEVEDKLEFNFSSTHLSRPDEVKIFYELSKLAADNVNAYVGDKSMVLDKEALFANNFIFQNYEEGEYDLRFYSKLVNERDHHFLPTIKIKVAKKKLSSFWWYLLGLTGFISLLLYIATERQNKFQSDIINQRDKLLLENQSLKYQQKALQLQMNPHFIFNVLNSINGLIAMGDNNKARKFINDFAQLMRTVLNQSRNDTISIEEEIKYLKNYLDLEAMSRGDSFDFQFVIDDQIEDDMHIQPMLIQPFVENSIVHGFLKLEHKGKIKIQMSLQEQDLKVVIEDNGVGRSNEAISNHKSVGLKVVKERLGSKYNYSFEDLKASDGSNSGTRVHLLMSIK